MRISLSTRRPSFAATFFSPSRTASNFNYATNPTLLPLAISFKRDPFPPSLSLFFPLFLFFKAKCDSEIDEKEIDKRKGGG